MKKFFLVSLLAVSAFINCQESAKVSAVDGLKSLVTELDKKAQATRLIGKFFEFLSEEGRLDQLMSEFIIALDEEEKALLLEMCNLINKINGQAAQPGFQNQFEILNRTMQELNNDGLTEQDVQVIMQKIQKECPLVVQWITLSEDLKVLQEAFGQNLHLFPLDVLLTKMIVQLNQV
jgi:hypothetical protein